VTLTVLPAAVITAVRGPVEEFAVAANLTVLAPVRAPPSTIVSQLALLVDVQEQPVAAVTPTVPVLAMEASDTAVEDTA